MEEKGEDGGHGTFLYFAYSVDLDVDTWIHLEVRWIQSEVNGEEEEGKRKEGTELFFILII